jgi:hypothetical protein
MIDNIFLIIILLTLIYIIYQEIEPMKDHNFEFLNSKSSIFIKNNVYSVNELIEITDLSKCNKIIKFDYGINTNLFINNKFSIYEDIIDPLQHTIDIDNVNYNLTSVRWNASKLSYNGTPIGLELQLVHQNFNSLYKLIIVLPLDLVNNNTESFKNLNYTKMTKNYDNIDINLNEKNNFTDALYFKKDKKINLLTKSLKNIYNLGRKYNTTQNSVKKLIQTKVLFPTYECCKNSVGQETPLFLCSLSDMLSNNQIYYQLEDRDGNNYLILDPIPFDEKLGLDLLGKISYDNLIVYIKDNRNEESKQTKKD